MLINILFAFNLQMFIFLFSEYTIVMFDSKTRERMYVLYLYDEVYYTVYWLYSSP